MSERYRAVPSTAALVAFLAISCLASFAHARDTMVVREVTGDWYVESSPAESLKQWQRLDPNSVIRRRAQSTGGAITITYPDGQIFEKRDCTITTASCIKPIYLPAEVNSRGDPGEWKKATAIVASAVDVLLNREPGLREFYRSRGGQLAEAVVERTNAGLDLTPVFANIRKGHYAIRLRSIPTDGKEGASAEMGPFIYAWDPDAPAPLRELNVAPGLYQLSLLERSGSDYESTGIATDVLVTTAEDHTRKAAAFEEARELTKKWGDDVPPETRDAFLDAYLYHLAAGSR